MLFFFPLPESRSYSYCSFLFLFPQLLSFYRFSCPSSYLLLSPLSSFLLLLLSFFPLLFQPTPPTISDFLFSPRPAVLPCSFFSHFASFYSFFPHPIPFGVPTSSTSNQLATFSAYSSYSFLVFIFSLPLVLLIPPLFLFLSFFSPPQLSFWPLFLIIFLLILFLLLPFRFSLFLFFLILFLLAFPLPLLLINWLLSQPTPRTLSWSLFSLSLLFSSPLLFFYSYLFFSTTLFLTFTFNYFSPHPVPSPPFSLLSISFSPQPVPPSPSSTSELSPPFSFCDHYSYLPSYKFQSIFPIYLSIYLSIYQHISQWIECSLMVRGSRIQSQVQSYQRLKNSTWCLLA